MECISHAQWSLNINGKIHKRGRLLVCTLPHARLSSVQFKGSRFNGTLMRKSLRLYAWRRRCLRAQMVESLLSSQEFDVGSSVPALGRLFQAWLTDVPNASLVAIITIALGAVGGSVAYRKEKKQSEPPKLQETPSDSESWLLTLNPTPFNRFIIARCASVCLDCFSDIDEHVYQKLSLGSHQVVTVRNERSEPLMKPQAAALIDTRLDYQRRCIQADDGGVLALDWPICLDLEGDHGLDTTLLLIPGTVQGSEDETLKWCVQRALQSGYFPIVVNPRGCGNSSLTTPRIYTAGDSDDVRTAVSYVASSRPWTTLTGIGWGFGANMLAKYLGEEANSTPLTAAVCVNNPFDLDAATKYIRQHRHGDLDKELTDGFVEILKSNKMLFQGHRNKFDVAGGLTATSVREFEGAISSMAHGLKSLESFYTSASSRGFMDRVKIPLLCIQDNSFAPVFSIPREAFEGNPYTTLLYNPLESGTSDANAHLNFALEWLAAVEIAFLKGRHPLLQGVDLTIKPSKEWNRNQANAQNALIEGKAISQMEGGNEYIMIEPSENIWAPHESQEEDNVEEEVFHDAIDAPVGTRKSETASLPEGNITKEEKAQVQQAAKTENDKDQVQQAAKSENEQDRVQQTANSEEDTEQMQEAAQTDEEKGQVQQVAQTVFSGLDVAMPGTLSDEIKQQVLDAVGRGETIITALQGAVPEEVRGKMATAVSAAVQARGISLQMVGFGKNMPPPTLPAGMKESIQEKLASVAKGNMLGTKNDSPIDSLQNESKADAIEKQKVNDVKPKSDEKADKDQEVGAAQSDAVKMESERKDPKLEPESTNLNQEGTKKSENVQPSGSANMPIKTESRPDSDDRPADKDQEVGAAQSDAVKMESESKDSKLEPESTNLNQEGTKKSENVQPSGSANMPIKTESRPDSDDRPADQDQEVGAAPSDAGKMKDSKPEPESTNPNQEGTKESENVKPSGSADISPPPINVQQALEALTGLDDSTQMAVNNVFGVLEGMLEQIEKEKQGDFQQQQDSNDCHQKDIGSQQQPEKNLENRNLEQTENKKQGESQQCHRNNEGNSHQSERNLGNSNREHSHVATAAVGSTGKFVEVCAPDIVMESESKDKQIGAQMKSTDTLLCKTELDERTIREGRMDELDNVHSRLKKTKISGFVLRDKDPKDGNNAAQQQETQGSVPNKSLSLSSTSVARNLVLDAMKMEVQRRIGAAQFEAYPDLKEELLQVANAVVKEVQYKDPSLERVLPAEAVVKAVASALRDTAALQQLVPMGVLVGVILASLVTKFEVVTSQEEDRHIPDVQPAHLKKDLPVIAKNAQTGGLEACSKDGDEGHAQDVDTTLTHEAESATAEPTDNGLCGNVMGAVAAAMGATAAFASSAVKPFQNQDDSSNDSSTVENNGNDRVIDDKGSDEEKENIASTIAGKALSAAAPVVPKKDSGEVDEQRLVAMIAELGQKAGFLKFLAKAALLWGGLRGAMNVTDRLLLFFRIADRPLHQRLLGFTGMVILMWSPILLPLMPTLLTEWASRSSGGVAKYASMVGFYGALIILVTIWGKRVRGYEEPLRVYGLRLEKLHYLAAGLAAGCAVVSSLYFLFSQLSYVQFVPSASLITMTSFPQFALSVAKLARVVVQAVVMGVAVAVVEELIFRSWLLEEIAVDHGYHKAILLSGLAFAIVHWSPPAIPGLWFLAIALAGARLNAKGDLSFPIGLHAGLVATNFVLNSGGFISYLPGSCDWVTGLHAGNPLAGFLGAAMAGVLAIGMYPWKVLVESSNM